MRAPLKFELDRRQGVLNIGYGAGSSPTFTNLTVTGVALFADGTAAAPSISFANSTNMGFFRSSANVTALSIGGVAQFFWGNYAMQGTGAGSYISLPTTGAISLVAAGTNQNITLTPSGAGAVCVGLANASPLALLEIGAVGGGSSRFLDSTTGESIYVVKASGTGNGLGFLNNAQASIARLLNSGRFLLGTTTDSGALLQIGNDSSVISGGMVFGTNTFFYRRGDGILGIGHATLPQLYLTDPSGNVFGFVLGTTNLLRLGGNGASGQTRIDSGGAQACIFDTSQNATFAGTVKPQLATTAGAPTYVKGAMYFDTTLNKLRIGGATAWETVTSV